MARPLIVPPKQQENVIHWKHFRLIDVKVINHSIFRNLKAFLYGEEHQMHFCNIPVFMNREKNNRKIWLRWFKKKCLNDRKRFSEYSVVNHLKDLGHV